MPIISLTELSATSGPLLGIDPGTKTFGIAVSDRTRLIASPLETIRRSKFSIDGNRIIELCASNDIAALIVGLPINMDGTAGRRAQSVRDFVANLLRLQDIPVFLWDERLSTVAVTRAMIQDDMSRKNRAENCQWNCE